MMQETIFLENPANTKQLPNYPIECYYNENVPYMSTSLLHWHFFCEMIILHEGTQQVIVGGKTVELKAGDVIYIHPQQVHEAIDNFDGKSAMTLLKFDTSLLLSEKIFEAEQRFFKPFLIQSGYRCLTFQGAAETINPYLTALIKEESTRLYGYEVRMRNLICGLIACLSDTLIPFQAVSQKSMLSENERAQFTELLSYISDHFFEDNLTEMALSFSHLSYSNFAVKFKKLYGKTFTEYINHVRIAYAQQLLVNTNYSMATISETCGYHDACYFSRIFHKLTGVAPLMYKQSHSAL